VSNVGPGQHARKAVDPLQVEIAELRESRKRVAEAAHADRRAIERALHDGVQQDLVAVAVDLQRLAGLVDGPAGARLLLDDIAAHVRAALDTSRELAEWIYPALLEGLGLASALRSAAENAGLTIVVQVHASAAYPAEIATALYWSCVEALSSASPGSQASITVMDADAGLSFEVVVEGHQSGERLARLCDRIEALDGRVGVENRPDGGSRLQGWLPLSR
jgi:signal transduction histidine kinase